jgi:hypothetical protein
MIWGRWEMVCGNDDRPRASGHPGKQGGITSSGNDKGDPGRRTMSIRNYWTQDGKNIDKAAVLRNLQTIEEGDYDGFVL